jgi:hypothetical protein
MRCAGCNLVFGNCPFAVALIMGPSVVVHHCADEHNAPRFEATVFCKTPEGEDALLLCCSVCV